MAIVEQESHRTTFMLLGVVFALVTAWMAWDEVITRRPWKAYQDEFAELAVAAAEEELAAARKARDENIDALNALAAEGAAEESRLVSPEVAEAYADAKQRLRKAEEDLKEEEQNLAFRKGESDEAFYYFNLEIGHAEAMVRSDPPQPGGLGAPCGACNPPAICLTVEAITEVVAKGLEAGTDILPEDPDRILSLVGAAMRIEAVAPYSYCALGLERTLRLKEAEVAAVQTLVDARLEHKRRLAEEVASYDGRLMEIEAEIESFTKPISEAEAKLARAGELTTEIIQRNLTHLVRVDRCESCHVAIDRSGFEDTTKYLNPHRTHPKRDVLLGNHPPERFGCTVCHDGQGPQTKGTGALGAAFDHGYDDHYWEWPLLDSLARKRLVDLPHTPERLGGLWELAPGAATAMFGESAGVGEDGEPLPPAALTAAAESNEFVQASCLKCHTHEIGLHEKMPCETDEDCSEGYACTEEEPPQPPWMEDEVWEEEFPPPFPLSCEKEDLEGHRLVDYAPILTRGAEIVAEVGCYGCHPIPKFANRPKNGPALRWLRTKTMPAWVAAWLKYPKAIRPRAKMPNFFPEVLNPSVHPIISLAANPKAAEAEFLAKRDFETKAITAFLMSVSLTDSGLIPDAIPVAGDAARGETSFRARGCMGCHQVDAEPPFDPSGNRFSHFVHAPNLGGVGNKLRPEWTFAWLKNPKALWPDTRMPSLRLGDQDAADMVAYLMTLDDGEAYEDPGDLDDPDLIATGASFVRRRGCPGCHDIPTLEAEGKIGVDLGEFGLKDPGLMHFGNMVTDHHLFNWYVWLRMKLTHPRSYGTERIVTRMPEFELTRDEISAVMVFLKGNRGTENTGGLYRTLSPAERNLVAGRRVMLDYNCLGCHNVDAWTGAIMASYPGPEAVKGPPSLWREGEKIRGPWAFEFMKDPSATLRPWLEIRMPSFGFSDEHSTSLSGYFAALSDIPFPFEAQSALPIGGDRLLAARTVFELKKCKQCHPAAGEEMAKDVDLSSLAPDLTLTKTRLRADFLVTFLTDPLTFVLPADTKMPTLFYLGEPIEDAQRDIELLRDFLYIYGAPGTVGPIPPEVEARLEELIPPVE